MVEVGFLVVIGTNGEILNGLQNRYEVKLQEETTAIIAMRDLVQSQLAVAKSDSLNESIIHFAQDGKDVPVPCARVDSHQMTQIGRSRAKCIDFCIDNRASPPTVPRFAARLIIDKESRKVGVYAGAFDDKDKIFLGENAGKMIKRNDGQDDGFTSNGVLLLKPPRNSSERFLEQRNWQNEWREVSILGRVFNLKGTRSRPSASDEVTEDNLLDDGSILDLGGVALLWRSTTAVVGVDWLEKALKKPGMKLVCPMTFNTVMLKGGDQLSGPHIYLGCGHVVSRKSSVPGDKCPIKACNKPGKLVALQEPKEPFFFADKDDSELFCFNPCGHVVNEKTARCWSNLVFLYNEPTSLCPFCGIKLEGSKFVKLSPTYDSEEN